MPKSSRTPFYQRHLLPSEAFADAILMKRFPSHAFRILIITSLFCMGMGSCSTNVEEACRTDIPALQKQFAELSMEVADATPKRDATRAIASVAAPTENYVGDYRNHAFNVARAQKDHWEDWSEARLVEAQRYEDFVRVRTELRPALDHLSALANELVAFNGYVERGQLLRMHESLQRASADVDAAARAVCVGTGPGAAAGPGAGGAQSR